METPTAACDGTRTVGIYKKMLVQAPGTMQLALRNEVKHDGGWRLSLTEEFPRGPEAVTADTQKRSDYG